jgi:phosphohistidine swiveling domain-containing protein
LTRALLNRWTPELPDDTASLLCSGTEGVLSTQMGRDILGLAKIAKQNTTVNDLLKNEQPTDAVQAIRDSGEGEEFITALTEFLAMHGHRALKEFELNSVRWEEDPSPVLGMVRNYLLVDTNLDEADSNIKAQRESLRQRVRDELRGLPYENLGNPRMRLIETLVEQTKYYMKLRENSRFYHIMGFYAVRLKILQIEQELLSKNIMKCKDDIFYLHWNEVVQLQTGEFGWTDVEDTIRARRMEHIRHTKMVPPKTIGMDIEEVEEDNDGKGLSGQGASPGRYEGIARVIMDPATDNEIEPGEILIAPYTDPAWTPLFLTANAAVIEVGSYLSHAGTIAREYGMPCVVDVANCTSKITTGTRISVDGSKGIVTILTQDEPV